MSAWILRAVGASLIIVGLTVAPAPWVLLWLPGMILIVAAHHRAGQPDRRPGYITDQEHRDTFMRDQGAINKPRKGR